MKRTAPGSGYDFGRKRQYRRNVWGAFKQRCPVKVGQAHALLMPSSEGDEVHEALRRGFREEHLHLVDKNPAIVAHLKRRFPRASTYGVELGRAAKRVGGQAHVANFDLCSCLNHKLTGELEMATAALADHSVVAVTTLRGREKGLGDAFDFMGKPRLHIGRYIGSIIPTNKDCGRASMLLVSLSMDYGFVTRSLRWGIYKSTAGNQTMLWLVVERMSAMLWADEAERLLRAAVRGVTRGDGVSFGALHRWLDSWFGSQMRGYPLLFHRSFQGKHAHTMRCIVEQLWPKGLPSPAEARGMEEALREGAS